jgi:hypothetical protein
VNEEVKVMWVDALLSGEFKQGRFALSPRSGRHCCLGVLCELAHRNGVVGKSLENSMIYYDEARSKLPSRVCDWADLDRIDPVTSRGTLVALNDGLGLTFAEIAEIIKNEF